MNNRGLFSSDLESFSRHTVKTGIKLHNLLDSPELWLTNVSLLIHSLHAQGISAGKTPSAYFEIINYEQT